jgi:hypothetical protein
MTVQWVLQTLQYVILETTFDLQNTSRPITIPSGVTSAIKRRRVPIQIVEDRDVSRMLHHHGAELEVEDGEKQPKGLEDHVLLQPISSRVLPRSNEPSSSSVKPDQSTIPPLPRQTTSARTECFKDAKQLRDTAKPSRIGGGIFRPSGNHTLFSRNDVKSGAAPVTTSLPVMVDGNVPQAPMTLFNFTKMWDSHMKDEDRWNILSVCDSTTPHHVSNQRCSGNTTIVPSQYVPGVAGASFALINTSAF